MSSGSPLPFSPQTVCTAPGPLVQIVPGTDGRPAGAWACTRVRAPTDRVWTVVTDVGRYDQRVPMIQKVKVEGTRATIRFAQDKPGR